MKAQNSDTLVRKTVILCVCVSVLHLVPQNKWPQLVLTGKMAVCKQTGQCKSRLVDGHDCVDS